MKTEDIPGGKATFREPHELAPRQKNLIKAAALAAGSAMAKIEPTQEPPPADREETEEEKAAREERNTKAALTVDLTMAETMHMIEMREATVIATLASWTLERPLPTLATIGDLPNDLYDRLDEIIGGASMAAAKQVNFDPSPDKTSPFGPSSDSAGSLRDETPAPL